MKINMWKLLFAALIASTAMVACKDERNNYMVDDTISFLATDNQLINVALYNEECDLTVIKSGKGQTGATARLEVSEAALEAYNTANGTDYKALPASYVTFSPAIKFSEKDIRKTVKVTWDDENINSLGEGNYAVAIELSVDNNTLEVPEARKVMVVSMGWSHLGMEADVAPVFSPDASRETAVYEGPVTIDNPISVMDITVNYEIDNSLIAAYNEANGTDYKAAPADLVSLAAASSQLEAGKSSTAFSLQILSGKLFNGNELKAVDNNQYLVPVRIKSLSNEAIGISRSVTYVPVSFNREVKGPWTMLEGNEIGWAFAPTPGNAMYTGARLFDGSYANEWISFINDKNTFPMVFVVDMGKAQVFTKFRIGDSYNFQGTYRDYQIYIADEYKGASTSWTLVASGMRDYTFNSVAFNPPYDKNDPNLVYDYPVQKMIAGRYMKFVILKCEPTRDNGSVDNPSGLGRGKLGDVQGMGF